MMQCIIACCYDGDDELYGWQRISSQRHERNVQLDSASVDISLRTADILEISTIPYHNST